MEPTERLREVEIVDTVIFYIEKKLQCKQCPLEVEKIFSIKYPNYDEIFEQHVGLTVLDYITKARINKAEKLLEHTLLSFKEIAIAIGLSGYFEFTELFKKVCGTTPSTYRNQLLQLKTNQKN